MNNHLLYGIFRSGSVVMSKKLKLCKMPTDALGVLLKSLTQKSHAILNCVLDYATIHSIK